MRNVVISLSGGMDSSTLLLHCLANGMNVTAVSFDYGQKHRVELERAKSLVKYLNAKGYNFKHQVIEFKGLSELLNSALVEGGSEVPEGHYEEDNMKDTVVPNRNKIFSSIVQSIALSKAQAENSTCDIALGIHAGDHAIYPDCRQEFRDIDMEAFREGNWESERVDFYTPYLDTDKFGILEDGQVCCEKLGVDFDTVYALTNTSYKPLQHNGTWYSDYKSASSVERIEAFLKLGVDDPVAYADETGPVSWETASNHVKQVLENHV